MSYIKFELSEKHLINLVWPKVNTVYYHFFSLQESKNEKIREVRKRKQSKSVMEDY